jgi:hypothetical protein
VRFAALKKRAGPLILLTANSKSCKNYKKLNIYATKLLKYERKVARIHTGGVKMIKIIRLKTETGFKLLKPGFSINLLCKRNVPSELSDNLYSPLPGLAMPKEYAFVGKNASGKSTVLELITLANEFLASGRIPYKFGMPASLSLSIDFTDGGSLYSYTGQFSQPELANAKLAFYIIASESLTKAGSRSRYKKDLSNLIFKPVQGFVPRKGTDTSSIAERTNGKSFFFFANDYYDTFSGLISSADTFGIDAFSTGDVISSILTLLDDGIEYIHYDKASKSFLYKRHDHDEIRVTEQILVSLLSDGTRIGLVLYFLAAATLSFGGTLCVDEIERSINKNLVENLISLFNDSRINGKGANLIFSTHYFEILDMLERSDSVDILHNKNDSIENFTISESYPNLASCLKSDAFNRNAFDTMANYQKLMAFKKLLMAGGGK